jgi:hypothetical protein
MSLFARTAQGPSSRALVTRRFCFQIPRSQQRPLDTDVEIKPHTKSGRARAILEMLIPYYSIGESRRHSGTGVDSFLKPLTASL